MFQLSIIIPLLNEQQSLEELFSRINEVMLKNDFSFEIIFVDDGSTDDSWFIIQQLSLNHQSIRSIRFNKNYGKTQALKAAFSAAEGDVIITMDADLQDFPEEIPALYKMITEDNFDLVSGWKKNRKDPALTKNLPSKLFNWVARKTSGVQLNDFNCGLKAYKKEVIKSISLHGDMHRYIPVLAKNEGFSKIGEKQVPHQARKHGYSKFGSSRFINGFLDLITLWFISKFGNKPMHLFGALGTLMFFFGTLLSIYIGITKLYKLYFTEIDAGLVTDNPWFYIALTCMVLGSQLFLGGFLGEILIRSKQKSSTFKIKEYTY